MFSLKQHSAIHGDLSLELREIHDWNVGALKTLEYHLDVAVLAVDPVSNTFAIGTANGVLHVFGAPGVERCWAAPKPVRVKFLQFAVSTSKLISIDDNDQLYIWDLSTDGQPKLLVTTRFKHPINGLTISPSHTHVFVALQSGEIKTYDLLCLRVSPYTIPNMLALYQEKKLADADLAPNPESLTPIEVVIHPRNLNLVFVGYIGGVVLSDLAQKSTLRVYRLILPPGAPGGTGLAAPDLLRYRRPSVTAIAIHPAGHFFAIGHTDGSISFWAIEDEDEPLLVRTLDEIDVNRVDVNSPQHVSLNAGQNEEREPIFKLAWSGFPNSSDPRGGQTALFVLGGQTSHDPLGVNVLWLPAFNPSEPPAAPGTQSLHPSIRSAMRESLFSVNVSFYPTSGIAQDFLLVPRDSPHFSGSWDPVAIVLLSDGEGGTRGVEAYQIVSTPSASAPSHDQMPKPTEAEGAPEDSVDELASMLESMKSEGEPQRMNLPPFLWSGNNAVVYSRLQVLDRDSYERLTANSDAHGNRIPISGGEVWIDEANAGGDMKFAKYQTRRVLVSQHRDSTVQFQDISAQILLITESSSLRKTIPNPLPSLTIDALHVLTDPSLSTRFRPEFISRARVRSVELATESLECYLVLETGEILVYRLDSDQAKRSAQRELADQELICLEHVSPLGGQSYRPCLLFAANKGPVVACTPSDVGFFAVSFSDGSLFVVDMRGPKIIFRTDKDATLKKSLSLRRRSQEHEVYASLAWTVCRLDSDPVPRVRLLAVQGSGHTQIFTLNRAASGSWSVTSSPNPPDSLSHPLFSTVIDARTGGMCKADRSGLGRALDAASEEVGKGHCYWVVAGAKGAKCVYDVDGERVGKTDWGHKLGRVECCEIVERNGSFALVAYTERREASVYSLPALEHMHTFQLPQFSNLPLSPDSTGDFIHHAQHPNTSLVSRTIYGTLFDIRRSFYHIEPTVDLLTHKSTGRKGAVPPPPQPVSMGPPSIKDVVGGWLTMGGIVGGKGVSGEQIDALLAGPNRPLPKPAPPKSPLASSSFISKAPLTLLPRSRSPSPGGADADPSAGGLYDRLTSAISERGQVLGDLDEMTKSLEDGTKSMVAQAKRLATEQGAKSWFGL